jgi:hypothetical protein
MTNNKNLPRESYFSILAIGDVFGRGGRRALETHLPQLKRAYDLDLVIANAENAAGGIGLTDKVATELFRAGADILTSGNHIWRYSEIEATLMENPRVLRPHNYPPGAPGSGFKDHRIACGARIGVLNLQGRVFMDAVDCPFRSADALLDQYRLGAGVDALIVDFHAEATSEKAALALYLDGRVSAVLGTHTHVPTADAVILSRGTAFQTDMGMTGCYNSVIGMRTESVLPRFLTQRPSRFTVAEGPVTLCGTWLRVDRATGKCLEIQPVRRGGILTETPLSP